MMMLCAGGCPEQGVSDEQWETRVVHVSYRQGVIGSLDASQKNVVVSTGVGMVHLGGFECASADSTQSFVK